LDDRFKEGKKNNFTIAGNESDNTIYMIAYQNDEMMKAYEVLEKFFLLMEPIR
jgi:hypothetical protein